MTVNDKISQKKSAKNCKSVAYFIVHLVET
jgi:hypothetical protein